MRVGVRFGSCRRTPLTPALLAGLVSLTLLLGAPSAEAFEFAGTQWSSTYPASSSDAADCKLCHINTNGGGNFNPYGIAILQNGGLGDLSGAFLAIESLNSDGVAGTNLEEIQANTQPGWCDPAHPACDNPNGTPPQGPLDDVSGCSSDAECADGAFCNGAEVCDASGVCQSGTAPCAADETCDESGNVCVPPPSA